MQTSRASSTESNSVEFPHRMASIGAARSPANGDRAHGRHAGHHRADTMFRLGRSDLPVQVRVRTDSQILVESSREGALSEFLPTFATLSVAYRTDDSPEMSL